MKKEQLSDALNLLDEEIIAEADAARNCGGIKPQPKHISCGKACRRAPSPWAGRHKGRPAVWCAGVLAACLVLAVGVGLATAGDGLAGSASGSNGSGDSDPSHAGDDSTTAVPGSGGNISGELDSASGDEGSDAGGSLQAGNTDASEDGESPSAAMEQVLVQISLISPQGFDGTVTDAGNSDILNENDPVQICIEEDAEIIQPDGSLFSYSQEDPNIEEWQYVSGDTVAVGFWDYSPGSPICIYACQISASFSDLVYRSYEHGFDISFSGNERISITWDGTGIPDVDDIKGVGLYDAWRDETADITEAFLGQEEIEITKRGHYVVYAIDCQGELIFLDGCISLGTALPASEGNGPSPL